MALGNSTLSMLDDLAEFPNYLQYNLDRINLFGVIRMIETTIINIDRIQLLWEIVSAHLECLANCKHEQLRALAVDGITCIVINTFLSRANIKVMDTNDKHWQKDMWQVTLLNSLLNCLKSGYLNTASTMIHNLPSIVTVNV